MNFLHFAILGIGAGAIYAMLGSGIVLVYRGSGVLNFAHGAIAIFAAFIYWELRTQDGWAFAPAFVIAVLSGALIGLIVQNGVMRQLRDAAPLAKVIATLGVFITLQAIAVLRWGAEPQIVPSTLPQKEWRWGQLTILSDRVILLGIATALALLLWWGYRYLSFGLATSATAENPIAASALGWSPNVIASLNWALGGALAAAAGVLIAPISGLNVALMITLSVAALTASLIGGFSSFPLTLLGGVFLGVSQSLLSEYSSQPGLPETFPLLVIIAVLLFRGKNLPLRSHLAEKLPSVGRGTVRLYWVVATFVILSVLLLWVLSTNLVIGATTSLVFAIFMLSVVVVTGFAGQLSLAQVMIGGVGAFVAGRLVQSQGWPFEFAAATGIVAAAVTGLLFGLPAIRARGAQLAVVTLALAYGIQQMLFDNIAYTGGILGVQVGSPKLFGIDIDAINHPQRYAFVTLVAFMLCALVVVTLRTSRIGRRLLVVRTNERAATALKTNVAGAKLYAFALASAIAGVGGILLAFRDPTIEFSTVFDPFTSILVVAFVVIGGLGYVLGAPVAGALFVAGGFIAVVFASVASSLTNYLALIGGVVVLVSVAQAPDGIVGRVTAIWRLALARLSRTTAARRSAQPADQPPLLQAEEVVRPRERVEPVELEISGVSVTYGALRAIDEVSLTVASGEVLGLIGPNGAGKTTVIDAITGYARVTGRIVLGGRPIQGLPAYRRARAGVSRSFQSLELIEDMTVGDNIRAAADSHDAIGYLTALFYGGDTTMPPLAVSAIAELGLQNDLHRFPNELSYGRRRLVAIARAVACGPSVLLLDEPAAGLGDEERDEVCQLLRRLVENWGIGIMLIEHDVDIVMRVSDRVAVLNFGKLIAMGTPQEVRENPAVVEAYLGSSATHTSGGHTTDVGPPQLVGASDMEEDSGPSVDREPRP